MKARRERREPLAAAALAVLDLTPASVRSGLILPGWNGPMSDMTLSEVLRANKIVGPTVHDLRSSFRDWAGDCTGFARETMGDPTLSQQLFPIAKAQAEAETEPDRMADHLRRGAVAFGLEQLHQARPRSAGRPAAR